VRKPIGRRLPLPDGLTRGDTVSITVDGRPVAAYLGESLAAALMADGVLATRTTTGGEARGVFCGMGVCFDCLAIVDGVPNVRACVTWVRDGMDVAHQDGHGRSSRSEVRP
jgi:D-hydroxyproline dehydrogenase subunit gamma